MKKCIIDYDVEVIDCPRCGNHAYKCERGKYVDYYCPCGWVDFHAKSEERE